jgi:predicted dehydrogenase
MIRLGIIGMGYTGYQHLRVCEQVPTLSVVAATDVDLDRLRELPPQVRAASDWRDLIASEDIDAVSICLPHDAHELVVTEALRAGKHVLVEKPLAIDLCGAEGIAQAAADSDRVVMVEMTHRFYPPMVRAREWVEAGRLGDIYAVEDRIVQPLAEGKLPAWMMQMARAGGGVALTNGVHMLDRIRWLCGQPLHLLSGSATARQGFGDIEDTAAMQLELADGTPVQLLAAWPRGNGAMDDELTVYGSKGTLRVWSWRGLRLEPFDEEPEQVDGYPEEMEPAARVREGMRGAMSQFADTVEGRQPPTAGVAELLDVHRLLDAFYRRTGRIQ